MDAQYTPSQPAPEQKARGNSRGALVAGFVLVLLGGAALVSELWPEVDRYVPLVVGVGLLGVFAITRSYLALVFGAIVTGVGVGLLVADILPGTEDDGPGATLGLGVGFVSIWVIGGLMKLKEHHFWPLIPGGILLLVGIGLTLDLFENDISRYFVPAIVLVVGLLIMLVGYLRMTNNGGDATA